jgi:hypothetical protein
MRTFLALSLAALPASAQTPLPSGLQATPFDILVEDQPSGESWLVVRYLAPTLADGTITYEDVVDDLGVLCESDGLVAAAQSEREIAQIVVILMDRPVVRGAPAPEAIQYIGAYLPIQGECAWNDF